MSELELALAILDDVDFDDLKAKYVAATKMLFALIQSVDEGCVPSIQEEIFGIFRSLIQDLEPEAK